MKWLIRSQTLPHVLCLIALSLFHIFFFFSHVIYVSPVALTDIYLTMACPVLGSLDWAALFSLSFGSVTPSY